MKGLVHVSLACLALAACGSDAPDFGPETTPTSAQETGIISTEQSLAVLAAADIQGAASAGAAFELATSSLLLIAPRSNGRIGIGRSDAWPPKLRWLSARDPSAGECVVVGASSVVWTNCMENGFTIDGTVTWGPGHVELDVTINGEIEGFTFGYQLAGNVTVSATAIKGDMTVSGSETANGTSSSQTVHSEIDVELAEGCISTGTLAVTVSGSGTGSVNGAVRVMWTGCHAFRVRNA